LITALSPTIKSPIFLVFTGIFGGGKVERKRL